jgi:hypothetical protein
MMSAAVAMSAAVGHLMELRAKMSYEPRLYVRLHRTLYNGFGKVAGPSEAMAVATTGALAWWTRRRHPDESTLTSVAAGALALAHGIYWSVVQPVNVEMFRWPLDHPPQDWIRFRDRWEYGHAVRAGLITAAVAALSLAALRDHSIDLK